MNRTMMLGAILLIITSFLSACAKEPRADTETIRVYDAATFFQTTSLSLARSSRGAFSSDGRYILINSDASGVFNAYRLSLNGGSQEALTHSDTNAVSAVSYFPGDGRFLYMYDQAGDERTHVFAQMEDGESRDLTPGPRGKASFAGWSASGDVFFIVSTERDERNSDLYRYNTQTLEREMVFRNEDAYELGAISKDGRHAAFQKRVTSSDRDLYLVDLTRPGAAPQLITTETVAALNSAESFTPESDKLIYTTDQFGEFTQAWAYDIATGEKSILLEAEWDVSSVSFSPSGTYRIVTIASEGSSETIVLHRAEKKALDMRGAPQGGISNIAFSADETKMAFTVTGDTIPSNIYVLDLQSNKISQLTHALTEEIDPNHLVESEIVRFKSYDGLEIPGLIYKPHGASAKNPAPAIVVIHGGPGLQARKGYQADMQHLINHGYAIYRINNRGSSGYGKTFLNMDNRKHGDVDLKDVIASRDYLAGIDWIDEDRIAVMGGSYGGYLTVAAVTFYPDTFDAAIDIFGPTNWTRTLTQLPPWWQAIKESIYSEMGDPDTDSERHYNMSPLFHAENIKKPLLVVQGANDPRVLQVESDELVEKVRANGVPVEYLLFPDEGHGFRKRKNRITASKAYLAFLNRYLKDNAETE